MESNTLHQGPSASSSFIKRDDNARLGQTKEPEQSDEDKRGPVGNTKQKTGTGRTEALARGFMKKANALLKAQNKTSPADLRRYPQARDAK